MKRHAFVSLAFLLAAHVTGCVTKPPTTGERANASMVTPPVSVATPDTNPLQKEATPDTRPALLPRFTDAIGLSTPEGRAKRQARKDVAASVPRSIGKGAVYAPLATEVVNGGNKSKGPTTNAAEGAVVTNTDINKNKASAATAPGATATTTTENGLSWWWLLVPAAGLALWAYRKTLPFIG